MRPPQPKQTSRTGLAAAPAPAALVPTTRPSRASHSPESGHGNAKDQQASPAQFSCARRGRRRGRARLLHHLLQGCRDWRLISVAREERSLDDLRAILGDDIAITAAWGRRTASSSWLRIRTLRRDRRLGLRPVQGWQARWRGGARLPRAGSQPGWVLMLRVIT